MEKLKALVSSAFVALTACTWGYTTARRRTSVPMEPVDTECDFDERGVDWAVVAGAVRFPCGERPDEAGLFDVLSAMLREQDDPTRDRIQPALFCGLRKPETRQALFRPSVTQSYLSEPPLPAAAGTAFSSLRMAPRPRLYPHQKLRPAGRRRGYGVCANSVWAADVDQGTSGVLRRARSHHRPARQRRRLDAGRGLRRGRCYSTPTVYARLREKSGPGRGELSPPVDVTILPEGVREANTLVVLTNGLTTSAAEFMVMALLRLPRDQVGDGEQAPSPSGRCTSSPMDGRRHSVHAESDHAGGRFLRGPRHRANGSEPGTQHRGRDIRGHGRQLEAQ